MTVQWTPDWLFRQIVTEAIGDRVNELFAQEYERIRNMPDWEREAMFQPIPGPNRAARRATRR